MGKTKKQPITSLKESLLENNSSCHGKAVEAAKS